MPERSVRGSARQRHLDRILWLPPFFPLKMTVPETKLCPFCSCEFVRLGNHLPHCRERKGDYSEFLSSATRKKAANIKKSKKCLCPRFGKLFKRLDTHLRTSATCKKLTREPCHLFLDEVPESTLEKLPGNSQLPSQCLHPKYKDRLVLPITQEDWQKVDQLLALKVVPAVIAASTVDSKNHLLCDLTFSDSLVQRKGKEQLLPTEDILIIARSSD